MSLLYWEVQQWPQRPRWVCPVQRGRFTSLTRLMQPKVLSKSTLLPPAHLHCWFQPLLVPGVIPLLVHDLGFPFMGRHEVPVSTFLQPGENDSTVTGSISHSWFCTKLLWVHSCPITWVTNNDITQCQPQDRPLGTPGVTALQRDFMLLLPTL